MWTILKIVIGIYMIVVQAQGESLQSAAVTQPAASRILRPERVHQPTPTESERTRCKGLK